MTHSRMHRVMILLTALLLCGCTSVPQPHARVSPYAPKQTRQIGKPLAAAKPPSTPGTAQKPGPSEASPDYLLRPLQPGDKVSITFMGIQPPIATFQTVVDEHGNLNLMYIGTISVGGRTKAQAEKVIERAYIDGEFFKSITVIILPPELEYFVWGEVKKPSNYPLSAETTFPHALSTAGGVTEYADQTKIQVKRRGTDLFYIDAKKIEKGEEKDGLVQPGDVIRVPRGWH